MRIHINTICCRLSSGLSCDVIVSLVCRFKPAQTFRVDPQKDSIDFLQLFTSRTHDILLKQKIDG